MAEKKNIFSWKKAWRFFRTLWGFYPRLLPGILVLIFINAGILSLPGIFMQKVVAVLEKAWAQQLPWAAVQPEIYGYVRVLALLYLVSLAANVTYNQLLAVFNQGSLAKFREKLFTHMETLPLGYFDRHQRGDVMSYYTNDVEALRQMISQSFPQLCVTAVTLTVLLAIMLYYSVWMSLVVVGGSLWSVAITRKVGGRSARYFMEQQHTLADCEGFMEESINGGKVIKVFNHEGAVRADFDRVNQALYDASCKANQYSNTLMPILNNVSYLIYIIVAACGGLFLEKQVPNLSLSGLPFSLSVMVPFLGMSRQFATNIQMISPQINAMVMGMAGAERIFGLFGRKAGTGQWDRGTAAPGRRYRGPALGLGCCREKRGRKNCGLSRERSISAMWILGMKRANPSSRIFPSMLCPARKLPWWGPRERGRPPSPTCSPGSTTFLPDPSPMTGSLWNRSGKGLSVGLWAWCSRIRCCLRPRCWKTSDMAGWMPPMRNVWPRPKGPAPMTLSGTCPRAMIQA